MYIENINGGRPTKGGSTAAGQHENLTHPHTIESAFIEMGRGMDFVLRPVCQNYLSDAMRIRRARLLALIAES